jgi:hypothetical protein
MMIRQIHSGPLLLLCFAVFLGHNLIPHHHHSELVTNQAGESCPIGHEDHTETGNHPAHCHAFNEVTFYKVESSGLMEDVREISLLVSCFTAIATPLLRVSEASHSFTLKIPLAETESGSSVEARAPPLPV